MAGKIFKKKWKFKKSFIIFIIAGILGGGVGYTYYHNSKLPNDSKITELSPEEEKSFIEVTTKLVKQNTKPKEIVASIEPRLSKMGKQSQQLAMDLIYTSIQNATFYYNSTGTVMSGEIEYNRKSSRSSLAATKNSAWVSGFVRDLEEQQLVPYSLSGAQIISLPNWELLEKNKSSLSNELEILVDFGKKAQSYKIFDEKTGTVDPYQSFLAYETILSGLNKLSNENQSSKYLADLNSLARLYHDIALGVVMSDNIELNNDGQTYTLSQLQIDSLKKIKDEAKDPVIKKEAETILGLLKENKVPGAPLKKIATDSQNRFGSSVFWQAEQDLSSIVTKKTEKSNSSNNENKENS